MYELSISDVSIAPYAERIAETSLTKETKLNNGEKNETRGTMTMTFIWQLKDKDNGLESSDMLSEMRI